MEEHGSKNSLVKIGDKSIARYSNALVRRALEELLKVYSSIKKVKIGEQIWMSENLDVDHYRNGDPIPEVSDPDEWDGLTKGAWCYYEDDTENGKKYCKLYNWYSVNDPRGLAPKGWHIPKIEEFEILKQAVGGDGNALKEIGQGIHKGVGTNTSGFSALLTGARGDDGSFDGLSYGIPFWSSSGYTGDAFGMYLVIDVSNISSGTNYKGFGFSVRCVKDEDYALQMIPDTQIISILISCNIKDIYYVGVFNRLFESLGIKVLYANNFEDLQDFARSNHIDLAIEWWSGETDFTVQNLFNSLHKDTPVSLFIDKPINKNFGEFPIGYNCILNYPFDVDEMFQKFYTALPDNKRETFRMSFIEMDTKIKNAHILVVDDETLIVKNVRNDLINKGFKNVHVAYDGQEAIDELKRLSEEDLVMSLGLKMPNVNGFEVMKYLAAYFPNIVGVIMLTGFADLKNEIEFAKLGTEKVIAYDFISKPWDDEELYARIKEAIMLVQAQRKQFNILRHN